jgi:hypothetical protein
MTGEMLEVYREVRGASAECDFFHTTENTISNKSIKYLERLLQDLDKQKLSDSWGSVSK